MAPNSAAAPPAWYMAGVSSSSAPNKARQTPPARGVITSGKASGGAAGAWPGVSPHIRRPTSAPSRMAPIWPSELGTNSTNTSATAAIEARSRSGHSDRAMPQTACATIATATSFRPCSSPAPAGDPVSAPAPKANAVISAADGRVKPHHAASPPSQPARSRPMEKPTWLEAGPGANWQSATRSA